MRYLVLNNLGKDFETGVLSCDMGIEMAKLEEELGKAGPRLAGDPPAEISKSEVPADYSEEAIPERDPNYRPLDDTIYGAQTVELLSNEVRLALASRLAQLGMSAARARMVVKL